MIKNNTLIVANEQSSGKGRGGNNFYSPADCGIYMSLVFKPEFETQAFTLITTYAATVCASTIEKICNCKIRIKWVNDLFNDMGKIAGILTESQYLPIQHSCGAPEGEGTQNNQAAVAVKTGALEQAGTPNENGTLEQAATPWIIVGIGINVFEPLLGYPDCLASHISSLYKAGDIHNIDSDKLRAKIIANIANTFIENCEQIPSKAHLAQYRKRSFIEGLKVQITEQKTQYSAKVLCINDDFSLQVLLEDGSEKSLIDGQVKIPSHAFLAN